MLTAYKSRLYPDENQSRVHCPQSKGTGTTPAANYCGSTYSLEMVDVISCYQLFNGLVA